MVPSVTVMEGVSEFVSGVEEERREASGKELPRELPGVGYGSLREEDGMAPGYWFPLTFSPLLLFWVAMTEEQT